MSLIQRLNRRLLLRYRFEYLVALLLVYVVRSMSPRFAWAAARQMGPLLFLAGLRRETILRNLRVAFPEKTEEERRVLGARCLAHFLCVTVDILFQKRMLSTRNIFRRIEFAQWPREYLDAHGVEGLRERAHGVLFMTAHLGNWELASGVFGLLGVRVIPVFRELRNPFLDRLLTRIRLDTAVDVVRRRGAVQVILERLKNGDNVGFLFDQEALHGPFIPFFGVPARTHKTPAVLARDFGTKIFFGCVMRKGDFLDYQARGQLLDLSRNSADRKADIEQITTELMLLLEEEIRLRPEQYFWMHRRWKRSGIHGDEFVPDKHRKQVSELKK